jgi:hypothetical protein
MLRLKKHSSQDTFDPDNPDPLPLVAAVHRPLIQLTSAANPSLHGTATGKPAKRMVFVMFPLVSGFHAFFLV